MIIIKAKEGESIDRMLRRYKRKHRDLKVRKETQNRRYYTKPSEQRKLEIGKARYINQKRLEWEG